MVVIQSVPWHALKSALCTDLTGELKTLWTGDKRLRCESLIQWRWLQSKYSSYMVALRWTLSAALCTLPVCATRCHPNRQDLHERISQLEELDIVWTPNHSKVRLQSLGLLRPARFGTRRGRFQSTQDLLSKDVHHVARKHEPETTTIQHGQSIVILQRGIQQKTHFGTTQRKISRNSGLWPTLSKCANASMTPGESVSFSDSQRLLGYRCLQYKTVLLNVATLALNAISTASDPTRPPTTFSSKSNQVSPLRTFFVDARPDPVAVVP